MLSPFHKKAPEHHRARHRTITDSDSEGVVCVSENKSKGKSFSFSGPTGSLHTVEAIAIAGSVYSNKKSGGRKKSTVIKRTAAPSKNVNDKAEEIVRGGDKVVEMRGSRTQTTPRTTMSSRNTAPSALPYSSFRPAARSKASTKVTTTPHSSSSRARAFKHESESQLTYGVWDEGRRLLVSAPKDSHEADLFRQVAVMTG